MMLAGVFFQGWLIGMSIAMPVGPIGMLCIQHSLIRGMVYGLIAGLGAALADALYGVVAGLGVTMVSNFLTKYQFWFHLGGALFLWYLGCLIFFSRTTAQKHKEMPLTLRRVFFTTFALTLTNPMTIVCFAGIYAGLGICTHEMTMLSAVMLSAGVLAGSAAWWLLLSFGVSVLGRKIMLDVKSQWLNRVSGSVILLFAIGASISVLQQMF